MAKKPQKPALWIEILGRPQSLLKTIKFFDLGEAKLHVAFVLLSLFMAGEPCHGRALEFNPEIVSSATSSSAVDPSRGVTEVAFSKTEDTPIKLQEPAPAKEFDLPDPFKVPQGLQSRVNFWVKIYSELTTTQGLLHDAKFIDIVYGQVDLKDVIDHTTSGAVRERTVQKKIDTLKKVISSQLRRVYEFRNDPSQLSSEEKRLHQLFAAHNALHEIPLATNPKRLRFQQGQKDRFRQGLFYSGRFMEAMEKIFKEKGLPVYLTRLPFVESSFNLKARSKVGASGIWQFMPSTGRLFLHINDTVDERNDPLRATAAAADLLKQNFDTLQSWPLAVTAYNHGRLGMVRAVQQVKSSEISEIIDRYISNSFGFASANFYSEFLAALTVSLHAEDFFDGVLRDQPQTFAEVVLADYIDFQDLATYGNIPIDTLLEYNPAFTEAVTSSHRLVPAGQILRIPPSHRDAFFAGYQEIPPHRRFAAQRHIPVNIALNTSKAERRLASLKTSRKRIKQTDRIHLKKTRFRK